MLISADKYCFEIPERWKEIVGARKRGRHVDVVLLWEENPGCSGLLVRLRCLKRRIRTPDDYTELLGTLSCGENTFFLYAAYGKEGSVSEENEDLYWRLRDQLYLIFDSITPLSGCQWQRADQN